MLEEADRKAEYLEREGNNSTTTTTTGAGVPPSLGPGNVNSNNNNNNNNVNGNRRRAGGPRGQEINKNGPSLSCLLTQVNRDVALKTHSLYEMGGNIGKFIFHRFSGILSYSLSGKLRSSHAKVVP